MGDVKARPDEQLEGSWKITEMETWGQDYVDLVVPGFVRFDGESGELMFGVVRGDLACIYAEESGVPRVKFVWTGEAEFDPVHGSGWAEPTEGGKLHGHIAIAQGDESSFEARRSPEPLHGYRPGPKWGQRGGRRRR